MKRSIAVVAVPALLLAACGGQTPTRMGAWPSDPKQMPQAYVTTPGMKWPAGVPQSLSRTTTQTTALSNAQAATMQPYAKSATTGTEQTTKSGTNTGGTTATSTQTASTAPSTGTTTGSTAPTTSAQTSTAATNQGFEITSNTTTLPVHPHAPELGNIPNNPTGEVDTSAVFRPTTANTESLEPSTQNVSRATYAEEGADFDPSLSRDGQWLVFASTSHRATSDIYVKRIDSRVLTQLTNDPAHDMCPKFSPDGKQIAFASDRSGNWDIYVMPVEGGRPVQVTFDAADEISPSWSTNGEQMVYSRMGESSGRWEMWIATVNRPEVATFIGYGLFPQWCPVAATGKDGADRILFQLGRERGRRTFGIWTIDVTDGQAGNASEIRSSSKNALINPSWSPDGKWVVLAEVPVEVGEAKSDPFATQTSTQTSTLANNPLNSTLWLVSVDNEAPVRLTFGNRLALSPVWSRSNRLYFVSNNTGVENIWSLDMTKPLTTAQAMVPSSTGNTYATQPEGSAGEQDNLVGVDENQTPNR